jgi:hypothetical protein
MKKGIIYVVLPVFMATIMTGTYLIHHKQEEKDNRQISKYEESILNKTLVEERFALIKNIGYSLSDSLYLLNLKNRQIRIDSILTEEMYFVLFFSAEYCSDCVNYSLTEIKKFLLDVSANKVLIFAAKYQIRDLFVFSKSYHFETQFYSIESLNLPIEQLNEPFMFLLDKELNPSCFFVPRKEIHEQTEAYLRRIREILQ